MADPLSTVAGVVGVLGFALHGAKRLYELIDGIQGAPHDVAAISADLKALYEVLGTLESMDKSSERLQPLYCCLQAPLDNCVEVFAEFTTTLHNFTHITRNNTRRKRVWSNIVWAFKDKEVQLLQDTLITYKASLDLAVGAINCVRTASIDERTKRIEEKLKTDMDFIRSKLSTLDIERDELASLTGRQGSEWQGTDTGFALKRFLDYAGTVWVSPPNSPSISASDIITLDGTEFSEDGEIQKDGVSLRREGNNTSQGQTTSFRDIGKSTGAEAVGSQKQVPSGLGLREQCIEAFFQHFYPAHPFVLPRSNYDVLRKLESTDSLEAAMRSVGSYYVPQAPIMSLGLEAERSVYLADCPKDGFLVQAMLILAIGLDGYTFQEKALRILLDAQDLALEIGMNKRAFASGVDSEVLAESWRRTWWELCVVDGLVAGAHQRSAFRMLTMPADVELPCEEKEYAHGKIPPAHCLEDFDNRLFDQRDFTYSSYSYRIGAIRNLGKVLHVLQNTPRDEPVVNRVDVHLVNWGLNLPNSKKDVISTEGQFDEMLFQAHMITAINAILLHRELSELDSSVTRNIISHAPYKLIIPGQSYNIHAAKAIQSVQDISKLIQMPVPVAKHSPFFIPVITLAAIVHLSCWSILMPLTQDDDLKQQLSLCTGALRSLWEIWPAAGKAYGQVQGVAQEIYAAKKQAAEVGFWANLTEDEVMRSMAEDQSIMEESQLLH